MSRLFYHVMQDASGNILTDVTGTMRIAGTGTLATIYGDEELTVILPNPMTNHPSFGSFKCYLGAGTYDFYLSKSGYTFETLTGVQGHGTMAQQDASAVAIEGGTFTNLILPERTGNDQYGLHSLVALAGGTNRWNLRVEGTAPNWLAGRLGVRAFPPSVALEVVGESATPAAILCTYLKAAQGGVTIRPAGADTDPGSAMVFQNVAGATVGSITLTASATAYNTSSDARLKRAVETLTGALDVVRRLRPITHLWNADDARGYGFLAHELQREIPDAVTGQPDEVNDDGSIKPQQVDHSKLVPWLTAALQDTLAALDVLTARVASLEEALGL